jgi:hypothetical protein
LRNGASSVGTGQVDQNPSFGTIETAGRAFLNPNRAHLRALREDARFAMLQFQPAPGYALFTILLTAPTRQKIARPPSAETGSSAQSDEMKMI